MQFRALCLVALWPALALASWGYTDDGSNYIIDSGAELVISVSKSNGDINSLQYNGVEYNGYTEKNTQVESGLGTSTVTIDQYTSPADIIKVSVTYGTLKHWIVMRYGNNNVYLFTNKADDSVTVLRYIVRIPVGLFSQDLDTDTDWIPDDGEIIEAEDVNKDPSSSYTYSKHYCGLKYGRVIDFDYVGYTNTSSNVGIHMIRSNHEKASGGPFFRSLQRRGGSAGLDLYDIYYYDMGNTDEERYGLQGPSVLSFTDGSAPNSALFARNADWDWFDTLDIDGWVGSSGRGRVAGVALSNMKSGYSYVAALSNSDAQYWGHASSTTGAYAITGVLPGTYTLTIYKGELSVHNSSVTVTANTATTVNTLTLSDPEDDVALWRIGNWDGTPRGFLNFGDSPMKPTYMHPSDTRLDAWDASNYIVGTSSAAAFPGYMWEDVNNDHLVYFKLNESMLAAGHTVRIGITEAYINGRPTISVNDWSATAPAALDEAETRSLTVGTYRGNNQMLSWDVPASAWSNSTTEWQVLTISVITGSTGTEYLSGGVSLDCVDMI